MVDKDAEPVSVNRRSFMRTLGERAIVSVGSALALGHDLRQEVITQLRDEGPRPTAVDGDTAPETARIGPSPIPSAWEEPPEGWLGEPVIASRLDDTGLIWALDQRNRPGSVEGIHLSTVSQVAQAMRVGLVDGGLALSQVAVQALAMAAISAGVAPRSATLQTLRGAARALAAARPDVPLVRAALDAALADAVGAVDEPMARRLSRSAGELARAVEAEHVQLARRGADWLNRTFEGTVRVLVAGEFGPEATGSIGTTSAILRAAADRGASIEAWVPAGLPSGRSQAMLAAALADTPVAVHGVSDVRLGTLLLERRVQVVILGASWASAGGSLAGEVGSRTIAVLSKEAGIPVIGVASGRMVVHGWDAGPIAPGERAGAPIPLEIVDRRWLTGILSEIGLRPALAADGTG